jgi:hypothetical protein
MGQARVRSRLPSWPENGHQGPFHAQRDPLPGQRQADADLLVG